MKKTSCHILKLILIMFIFVIGCSAVPVYANNTDINAFPESYRNYIRTLISAHPNWTFVPYNTNIEWSELVKYQSEKDRSLIEKSSNPEMYFSKAPGNYDSSTGRYIGKSGSNWVVPTEEVVMHYLDPRNFLTPKDVFMFLKLDYEPAVHTVNNVNILLSGSWMYNARLEDDASVTYAQAFVKSGAENNVSPFLLAARVRQEQGSGTSSLISGRYPGYEGYYNYFNINASGSTTNEIIVNGLKTARANGWNTRYKSINGGAKTLATRYIARNQYTLYFQKFDVVNGISYHQYMQNIQAPYTEGRSIYNSYVNAGIAEASHVFSIPVYKNMPSFACPLPGQTKFPPQATIKAGKTDRMYGTMSVTISNITTDSGVASVEVRAYSTVNGADDVHTYQAQPQENGTYTATVNIRNHGGYLGEYTIESYVTDNTGYQEFTGSVKMTITDILEASMNVTQLDDKLYVTIFDAEGYNGILDIRVPTWSDENGQDDLVWYKPEYDPAAGYWKLIIDLNNHSLEEKKYHLHLYITDGNGKQTLRLGKTLELGSTEFIYGDVNFDSRVDSADALELLKIAAGLNRATYAQKIVGDADQNEIINAYDALYVLQKAAGLIDVLPISE